MEQFPDSNEDLVYFSSNAEVRYLHAPYFKNMTDAQRAEYSNFFLETLRFAHPDLIFFSNFKARLDSIVPNSFSGMIVNVHPSFLPENPGWRTELMALEGKNPQASGYTFQVMMPELDKGPTLFQQRVSVEGHDEESLRLTTIWAQLVYTPRVLSLYASNTGRIVVQGRDAFAAEDRSSHFDGSEQHSNYKRILFENKGRFMTMEQIFGSPEFATQDKMEMITTYIFRIIGNDLETQRRLGHLTSKTQEIGKLLETWSQALGSERPCRIKTTRNIGSMLDAEGIKYEVEPHRVRANAPRIEVY